MTTTRTARILDAIADCDRFIAKEEKRSDALRPEAVAQLLTFYRQHRVTLVAMLEAEA